MALLTPVSSRKRPSHDDGVSLDGASSDGASSDECNPHNAGPAKRQRTSSWEAISRPKLCLSIPGADCLPTPPSSVGGVATMALKLVIPQDQTTREQERRLKRHRADAERWKPKLQRPFPKLSELKNAYPLKLMRHYHDASVTAQPNFVKPEIDKSPRLSNLLRQFPLIDMLQHTRGVLTAQPNLIKPKIDKYQRQFQMVDTLQHTTGVLTAGMSSLNTDTPPCLAVPLSVRMKDLSEARSAHRQLHSNIQATGTEYAQHLAWQAFSLPEVGRLDRGRESMILSGLPTGDLRQESLGHPNKLPDWRKPWTGRFATRHQGAS